MINKNTKKRDVLQIIFEKEINIKARLSDQKYTFKCKILSDYYFVSELRGKIGSGAKVGDIINWSEYKNSVHY